MTKARILVGDSVFEDATLTVFDGRLHVEFEDDDLDNLAIPLECVRALLAQDEDAT